MRETIAVRLTAGISFVFAMALMILLPARQDLLPFGLAAALCLLAGCGSMKVSKSLLKMMLAGTNKVSTELFYADSLEKKVGIPYVANGDPNQVLDIYYADKAVRKDAVLIDIHGGFYVAGKRENNRRFASIFLREGYDVVLLEYRLNDGKSRDQSQK